MIIAGRRRWAAAAGALALSCVSIQICRPGGPADLSLFRLGATIAYAAADLSVSTPAIRNLKASLASRLAQLRPFYAKGAIGEANSGLLAPRDISALSLQEKAAVSRLVGPTTWTPGPCPAFKRRSPRPGATSRPPGGGSSRRTANGPRNSDRDQGSAVRGQRSGISSQQSAAAKTSRCSALLNAECGMANAECTFSALGTSCSLRLMTRGS